MIVLGWIVPVLKARRLTSAFLNVLDDATASSRIGIADRMTPEQEKDLYLRNVSVDDAPFFEADERMPRSSSLRDP